MVTRAKVDTVHNRRIIARDIRDKTIVGKLFTEISPQYSSREGGYTRILKLGYRNNDSAEMVLLELVDREQEPKKKKAKKEKVAAVPEKTEKKATKEAKPEVEPETAADTVVEPEPEPEPEQAAEGGTDEDKKDEE